MRRTILSPIVALSALVVVLGGTGSACRYYDGAGPGCDDGLCDEEIPCEGEGEGEVGEGEGEGGEGEGEGEGEPTPTDSDGDGLSDEFEAGRGTDPENPDTDGDGTNDGDEVACNSSPLDSHLVCPEAPPDGDSDGLTDDYEAGRGTDPAVADTDADGDDDGEEVACGSSPLDPHFTCANPPAPSDNPGCG